MQSEIAPERDVIHVAPTIAPDEKTPLVNWHLNGNEGTLTLSEARERAEAFFMAAAIAETEARIALKLSGLEKQKPKGFGKKSSKPEKFFYQISMLMRDERISLPDGITPIFGWETRQALIDVDLYSEPIQWLPNQAREHARWLMECAEAAETDRFLYFFYKETLDLPAHDTNKILQEFSVFRRRTQLENLLKK